MHMQYQADPDDAHALPAMGRLYLLTALVAVLVAADLAFGWLGYESWRNPWGVNLSLLAALAGGSRIIYASLAAMWEGRVGADLALAIAMLAALALKEYWVGAEVVLIAMVGESLEGMTFARTHREIKRVLDLRPRQVRVRRGGEELDVPIELAALGETAIVRPGERIPIDGTVLAGRSTVDQSTLTGESLPVDKGEHDSVFAGTLNQFGALEVRIDAVGEETTLGQVIRLVLAAQRDKARVERIADRMARYFLPLVLGCAAATFVFSNFAMLREPGWPALDRWVWMPMLAVLVVTCPCSLVLATPAAMMAALAWLARRGVLMKGGAALERLATVDLIAFDKTGTLTTGRLQMGDCLPLAGRTEDELLQIAAAAEQTSEHVIGRAVVDAARSRGLSLPAAAEFAALAGAGVVAKFADALGQNLSGAEVVVGNRRLMTERQIEISSEIDALLARLEASGQTPLVVAAGGKVLGAIGVRDTIRPEAASVIRELRELGIEEIVLLTGDRPAVAAEVARQVGIDRWHAELRPEEKARWLAEWRNGSPRSHAPARERPADAPGPRGDSSELAGTQSVRGDVPTQRVGTRSEHLPTPSVGTRSLRSGGAAMVGDGVNDAPALASADVGIALAGVGSDLVADAGDLLLMGEPLAPLADLLRLSRETVRVIRQNIIVFAFFVNFAGVALTAWIMPAWSETWMRRSPVAAALFHQCGSLLVLVNSMRLLWFERWRGGLLGRLETALSELCWQAGSRLAPVAAWGRAAWTWRRPLAKGLATLAVAAYLTQVAVFVQPDEAAVVRRFGRFHAVLGPGPHLRLPPPWDSIVKEQPARVRTIEIGLRGAGDVDKQAAPPIEWNTPHEDPGSQARSDEAIALTGDQSLVELGAAVQYRIADVRAYHFGARDPVAVLRAEAESAIRQILAAQPLLADPSEAGLEPPLEILTTGRGPFAEQIRRRLQTRLDSLGLGIEILPAGVCLGDVHPPLEVVDAFRDVSSAFKQRERMKNEADAFRRDRVIKAGGRAAWQAFSAGGPELTDERWQRLRPQLEGEAAAELLAAEAFAIDRQERAAGEAAGFASLEAAHAAAPLLSEWRLHLDALSASLAGKKKLIFDSKASGRRHLFLGPPYNAELPPTPTVLAPPAEED